MTRSLPDGRGSVRRFGARLEAAFFAGLRFAELPFEETFGAFERSISMICLARALEMPRLTLSSSRDFGLNVSFTGRTTFFSHLNYNRNPV